jgi:Tol biopolymer transport system component
VLAVPLTLIAISGLVWFLMHRAPSPSPSAELTQKRLTFNASENPVESGAISPDGKYLAYSDQAGIHVKLLSTGEERLIPKPTGASADPGWGVDSWFPDGTQLLADTWQPACTADEPCGGGHHSMWSVSLLGQSPRELREGAGAWEVSPDGTRIAFSPAEGSDLVRQIWVMGMRGDNPQEVFALEGKQWFNSVHWSPDGQRLAYLRVQAAPYIYGSSIETCDLKGANRTVVVGDTEPWLRDFCWLPDGRIVYSRLESPDSDDDNLWQTGIDTRSGAPIGKPKRVTQWAGSYLWGLTASADGKRLTVRKATNQAQVYVGGTHGRRHANESASAADQ